MNIKEFFQKNKILSIAGVSALIIILILAFWGLNSQKRNLKDSPIQELSLKSYYSKSARDEEKKEQSSFKIGDPIQINIDYKNAFEKTPVTFEVQNSTGSVIQSNDFDIYGTESIYVSVGSIQDGGSYKARLKYNNKVIASVGFRVSK